MGRRVKKQGAGARAGRRHTGRNTPKGPAGSEGETDGRQLVGFTKPIENALISSRDQEFVTKGMWLRKELMGILFPELSAM